MDFSNYFGKDGIQDCITSFIKHLLHETIRIYFDSGYSKYINLCSLSIKAPSEKVIMGGYTALSEKNSDKIYIAYKYLHSNFISDINKYFELDSVEVIESYLSIIQQHKINEFFTRFMDCADNAHKYLIEKRTPKDPNLTEPVKTDGIILIWDKVTKDAQKLNAIKEKYHFADILSIEDMMNEMVNNNHMEYINYILEMKNWFNGFLGEINMTYRASQDECRRLNTAQGSKQIDFSNCFGKSGMTDDTSFLKDFLKNTVYIYFDSGYSKYINIGNATISDHLDYGGFITLSEKSSGKIYIAGMKNIMLVHNLNYFELELDRIEIIGYYASQQYITSLSFIRFLDCADNAHKYLFENKIRQAPKQMETIKIDGIILIWDKVTKDAQKLNAIKEKYHFTDILSIEDMMNEMVNNNYKKYNDYVLEIKNWIDGFLGGINTA